MPPNLVVINGIVDGMQRAEGNRNLNFSIEKFTSDANEVLFSYLMCKSASIYGDMILLAVD